MPKLDVRNLRFLTRDDFRALSAVEQGMKNHDLVPVELIASLAGLRHGGIHKVMSTLLKFKLVSHDRRKYDGYKLTYGGYDYLALRAMLQRGSITGVGSQIGVGKESDIFLATNAEGDELVLKLQRLGRTSFRAIKSKRDYLQHRQSASWLYMSRLGALKEYAFMTALKEAEFPTPTPIDCSRHAVLMSRVMGRPLCQVSSVTNPGAVFEQCMSILIRMAQVGLVHCDFNEFNIMVSPTGTVTMIDFPQMVSTEHPNATELFDRDVAGLMKFFRARFGYIPEDSCTLMGVSVPPTLPSIPRTAALDAQVAASGFSAHHAKVFADLADEGGQLFAHTLAQQVEAAEEAPAEGSSSSSSSGGEEEEEEDEEAGGAAPASAAAAAGGGGGDTAPSTPPHTSASPTALDAEAAADDHDFSAEPLDLPGEVPEEAGPTDAELGRIPDGLRRRADGRRVLPSRSHAVNVASKAALLKGSLARAAARGGGDGTPHLGLTDAEIRERVKRSMAKKGAKKKGSGKPRNKVKNREVTRLRKEAADVSADRY